MTMTTEKDIIEEKIPETIDVFVMFFNDFICGVFDSIEKAENKRSEFLYKNRHWCGGDDGNYEKFSIKKYNISKPINSRVFVLKSDSDGNFRHIFGLENEYHEYIRAFDSRTYKQNYYINEVRG